MENGIKPIYVFDGKPPTLKGGELAKRMERRAEAQENLEKATETGDAENMEKFSRRLVKVTKEHGEECRTLLKLMGVPFVEAPCEAEAQCCELVKTGKAYAIGTEDMDALTFGGEVLLRHLTFSEARKMPIKEFHYSKIISSLEFTQSQFIDLCILMGCDYCDTIKGVGPKRAIDLIKEHKSIEVILEKIDTSKYTPPENWLYKEARELFLKPDVTDGNTLDLVWSPPDEEGIIKFMCVEKGFAEDRMRNGIKKILKSRSTGTQVRLDSFFKVTSTTPKRKNEDPKDSANAKKAKKTGGAAASKATASKKFR
jgi:flap endonuclease-1